MRGNAGLGEAGIGGAIDALDAGRAVIAAEAGSATVHVGLVAREDQVLAVCRDAGPVCADARVAAVVGGPTYAAVSAGVARSATIEVGFVAVEHAVIACRRLADSIGADAARAVFRASAGAAIVTDWAGTATVDVGLFAVRSAVIAGRGGTHLTDADLVFGSAIRALIPIKAAVNVCDAGPQGIAFAGERAVLALVITDDSVGLDVRVRAEVDTRVRVDGGVRRGAGVWCLAIATSGDGHAQKREQYQVETTQDSSELLRAEPE